METSAPDSEPENGDQTLFRLIDTNIIGVATCDAEGRILEANDAYLEMLGYSREDLTSGRLAWRQLTPPEWQAISAKAVKEIEANGRCEVFEKEYFRKDGSRVPILLASAAIDDARQQIVGFVLDLTPRKRAEKALKRTESYLAEAQRLTHTGSWATTPGAERATYWSEEAFRIFETAPTAGPLDNDGLLRAMHPEDRDRYQADVGEAMRHHRDFAVEFRILLDDGTIKHLQKIGHPVVDTNGSLLEWVGTVIDLTERKTAEQERERAERLANEREAAMLSERTRMASEIHDTLAQALAMIVMQLADAEAKLGSEWSRAEKPLSMVRELAVESLAYARRSVNVLRPSVATGGLARTLRDLTDSLSRHFAGSVDLTVQGDGVLLDASVESALAGIAREAIMNSVKHSSSTRIGVDLDFAKGGAVRVVVSDDGIGFDPNAVHTDSYGLVSMQERAARARVALTFVTEPGAGATIIASWSPETTASTSGGASLNQTLAV